MITFLVVTNNTNVTNLDKVIYNFINTHQSSSVYNFLLSITKIGDVFESFIIFLIFGLFLMLKDKNNLYKFIQTTFLGLALVEIIKYFIQRTRPVNPLELGLSFPSAHATLATVFLLSSIFLLAPLIKEKISKNIFLTATSIIFPLIAFSRIYLSVHWTSDVVAGIILGSVCFIFSEIICCHKKENVL